VSIVLNARAGAERIPAVTRERILAAARDLNYRPNVLAQSLRRGKAFAIAGRAESWGIGRRCDTTRR